MTKGLVPFVLIAALSAAGPARAESAYTKLDLDACTVLSRDDETGGVELRCKGYGGFDVYVSDFDARMSVDFGTPDDRYETFAAFNSVGDTIEWLVDENGVQAAVLRYLIDVDGRKAQALVASKVGRSRGSRLRHRRRGRRSGPVQRRGARPRRHGESLRLHVRQGRGRAGRQRTGCPIQRGQLVTVSNLKGTGELR